MLRRFISIAFLILWSGVALAQDAQGKPDYKTWRYLSLLADDLIDRNEASDEAMETLRLRLVQYREDFRAAQRQNANRIANVQAQLAALGEPPENGIESPDIARQRADLQQQLIDLRAPVRTADAAFSLAAGLIQDLDRLMRQRRSETLVELTPSPLNPKQWPKAYDEFRRAFSRIGAEARANLDSVTSNREFKQSLPRAIPWLILALLLIFRGRRWSEFAGDRLRRFGGAGTGIWSFFVSLGRIVLPLLGMAALSIAIIKTGLTGPRTRPIVEFIPVGFLVLLNFWWVADRVFAKYDEDALLPFSTPVRRRARYYVVALAFTTVASKLLEVSLGFDVVDKAVLSVIHWPIFAVSGLLFFLLGRTLRSPPQRLYSHSDDDEDGSFGNGLRFARIVGLLMMVSGIAAPVVAAIGYVSAADAMLYPLVFSSAVLGIVLALHRLIADIYGWATGKGTAARDALVPVLGGFLLTLASVPIISLFWGVRRADLQEMWLNFLSGASLGGVNVSPTVFLTFAAFFSVGYLVTRLIQGALKNNVLPKTSIDPGAQNAIVSGLGYLGIFLAAVIAITAAGIDLSSIALVAGALSVGIGFGLQTIVSNFISGIILLIERPIAKGDWIEVGGQMGYVRDISVRSTRIETFDRSDVIVPNADLISGTVTNFTRGNTIGRMIAPVGVAYGTDTREVERILLEIAEEHPMVVANPAPYIVFKGFGGDALQFEVRAILRDVNWVLNVHSDINHEIAKRFAEAKIEIPFAQRDIWLRNPEVLSPEVQEIAPAETSDPPVVKGAQARSVRFRDDPNDSDGAGDGDAV